MKISIKRLACVSVAFLIGNSLPSVIQANGSSYSPPSASGLSAIRAYPSQGHVCQLLRVKANIAKYKKAGTKLIACPKHEKGAISDRRRQGAKKVGTKGSWVILRTQ